MQLTIVLIEDHPTHQAEIMAHLTRFGAENKISLQTQVYSSGEEYFSQAPSYPSAYLLDIELSGMNGMEVARRLRQEGYQGYIFFLTASREYAIAGYSVHAQNYLLKPLSYTTLADNLLFLANSLSESAYVLSGKQGRTLVPYRDILCFTSCFHYVDITTDHQVLSQYTTLNEIADTLPTEFVRVHRSHIVNMAHMSKLTGSRIFLTNGMSLPIGRTYLKELRRRFADYTCRLRV